MLHLTDFIALSPLLIVLAAALFLLFVEAFCSYFSKFSPLISLLFLSVALLFTYLAPASDSPLLTPWVKFDSLVKFFTYFFLSIGIGSTLLSWAFFDKFSASRGEYFFLLMSALFGLLLIGVSADFLTLFLGIETLSISLYILCGYIKRWESSQEASLKYFFMGAIAAAFLLYGIALIYGATGTTSFNGLLEKATHLTNTSDKALFLGGIALVTLGLCFEAAIVPFHVWAPDVYDGAPTPVTAFMAVGTKVGAFAAFMRVFMDALPNFNPLWNEAIAFLAFPTVIYANIVAIRQTQVRRFFAYSGISHAGFMLIPLAAGTPEATTALKFYLVIYALATLGAFAAMAFIDKEKEGPLLEDLKGLFYRSPLVAATLSLSLLTLAAIPPTPGFIAKFYLFKVAFDAGYYSLVIVGLLTTVLSAYYYLRLISLLFAKGTKEKTTLSYPAAITALVATCVLLLLAFYPNPLMDLLQLI